MTMRMRQIRRRGSSDRGSATTRWTILKCNGLCGSWMRRCRRRTPSSSSMQRMMMGLAIIGNRNGYLRAAIEMLRASATPLSPGDFITNVDFSYLGSDRSLIVTRLTRSEDIESALPPLRLSTWKGRAIWVGCLVTFFFLVHLYRTQGGGQLVLQQVASASSNGDGCP